MLTWPLASTAIVVLTLALALAWYERSAPSPRVVALVATMAALAVIGRIAFAPIPNVKPTTDLVLLSGLAFGAIPGFAVGATTALVSNLFFGQGLHTPWQMLAWGGVGVLGALVGRLLGERPNRYALALVCAAAGFAFGAFMDLSLWATVAGQHTMAEYLAISLRSLPFNVAHALGNAAFAVAFAPVLLAALARARARADVTIHPLSSAGSPATAGAPGASMGRGAGAALGAALLALALAGSLAAPQTSRAATKAPVDFLLARQLPSGGFGDDGNAGPLESGWAAMALGASPGVPSSAKLRAADYLRQSARGMRDPGDLERTILGLRALGAPAKDATGRDLIEALLAQQQDDGSFAGLVNQTAFGILALRSAGRSRSSAPVKRAAAYLLGKAGSDGGFTYSGKGESGVDDTAGAIQALIAAGRGGSSVTKRAVRFLLSTQVADGGFTTGSGARSNAQSTAWAVQALIAAGQTPARVRAKGKSPTAFLRSLIVADGHVRYSRTSDQTPVWVTAQAQLALAGTPLPVMRSKAEASLKSDGAAPNAANAGRREARRSRNAKRARALARREARRHQLATVFSDGVLMPTAASVMLLAAVFRVG